MTVLITGGCGFIGSNAAIYFDSLGHDVVCIDNLSRPGASVHARFVEKLPRTRLIAADLTQADPADVDQLAINRFADWTVYQSEFCRTSFEAEGAGVSRSTVIVNGVDLDVLFPAPVPPPDGPVRLVALAWSPNVHKGGPDVARPSRLPGVEVTFVGNWPPGVEPGAVRRLPPQPHRRLSELLREHHALLHMGRNDPCSHAVLEAMACGLPVVYHPSGGNPEIVGNCGVPCHEDLNSAVGELRALSVERAADGYLDVFVRLAPVPPG